MIVILPPSSRRVSGERAAEAGCNGEGAQDGSHRDRLLRCIRMARCVLHRHDEYREAKPSATFRGLAVPLGVFQQFPGSGPAQEQTGCAVCGRLLKLARSRRGRCERDCRPARRQPTGCDRVPDRRIVLPDQGEAACRVVIGNRRFADARATERVKCGTEARRMRRHRNGRRWIGCLPVIGVGIEVERTQAAGVVERERQAAGGNDVTGVGPHTKLVVKSVTENGWSCRRILRRMANVAGQREAICVPLHKRSPARRAARLNDYPGHVG